MYGVKMGKIKGFVQPWENYSKEEKTGYAHFTKNHVLLWGKNSNSGMKTNVIFIRKKGTNKWKKILWIMIVEHQNDNEYPFNKKENRFIGGKFKNKKCVPEGWFEKHDLELKYFFVVKGIIKIYNPDIIINNEYKNPRYIDIDFTNDIVEQIEKLKNI